MTVAQYGIPPLLHNTIHLYEPNMSVREQLLTMDETAGLGFELAENQILPYVNTNHQISLDPQNINSTELPEFSLQQDLHQNEDESPSKVEQQFSNMVPAMSSAEIMRLAGTQYIRGAGTNPFIFDQGGYFATLALPREDQNSLEIAHCLLSVAEVISNKQYGHAIRLLNRIKNQSFQWGTPIQRLSHYVSESLIERVERETGELKNKNLASDPDFAYNIEGQFRSREFYAMIAHYTKVLPFVNVLNFTAIQAIMEVVGQAKRIHIIDLGIRTGSHWTVLIQSLALRGTTSLELLKITAVGVNGEELKTSGRRLHEFAKSLGVPFYYKMVKISNIEEINEGLFTVGSGETVAVNSPTVLRTLLYDAVLLEKLVGVIKKLRQSIMVNSEVEAERNSPTFVNRFIEVVFYYSHYFDMFEVIFDRNDAKRTTFEELFCGQRIRNMIACEGKERRIRHVKTDVWRCFFIETGFKEIGFSYRGWYQARLLLSQFAYGECFDLEANGLAMTVGWKGTPLHALSAWTFH